MVTPGVVDDVHTLVTSCQSCCVLCQACVHYTKTFKYILHAIINNVVVRYLNCSKCSAVFTVRNCWSLTFLVLEAAAVTLVSLSERANDTPVNSSDVQIT